MSPFVEDIIVVTRSRWMPMLLDLNLGVSYAEREPSTLLDAITCGAELRHAENYFVGLADTYFHGENPYELLSAVDDGNAATLAVWELPTSLKGKVGQVLVDNGKVIDMRDKDLGCEYEYMWGALSLNYEVCSKLNSNNVTIDEDILRLVGSQSSRVGAVIVDGHYFDIGTLELYQLFLRNLLKSEH